MSREFEMKSVSVEELPTDRRDAAEQEMRRIVNLFEPRADKLGLVEDVELVVVLAGDGGAR